MTTLQKLPKNVGDLGKLIVAKEFKKLPKVAQSGHTDAKVAATLGKQGHQSDNFMSIYLSFCRWGPLWLPSGAR